MDRNAGSFWSGQLARSHRSIGAFAPITEGEEVRAGHAVIRTSDRSNWVGPFGRASIGSRITGRTAAL
jgi:hypothetical protein